MLRARVGKSLERRHRRQRRRRRRWPLPPEPEYFPSRRRVRTKAAKVLRPGTSRCSRSEARTRPRRSGRSGRTLPTTTKNVFWASRVPGPRASTGRKLPEVRKDLQVFRRRTAPCWWGSSRRRTASTSATSFHRLRWSLIESSRSRFVPASNRTRNFRWNAAAVPVLKSSHHSRLCCSQGKVYMKASQGQRPNKTRPFNAERPPLIAKSR